MAGPNDLGVVCADCGERFASEPLLATHRTSTHGSPPDRPTRSSLHAALFILGFSAVVVALIAFAKVIALGLVIAAFAGEAIGTKRRVLLGGVWALIAVAASLGEVWLHTRPA